MKRLAGKLLIKLLCGPVLFVILRVQARRKKLADSNGEAPVGLARPGLGEKLRLAAQKRRKSLKVGGHDMITVKVNWSTWPGKIPITINTVGLWSIILRILVKNAGSFTEVFRKKHF